MDYPTNIDNFLDVAKTFFPSIITSDTFLTIIKFIFLKAFSFLGRTLIEKTSDLILSKVIKSRFTKHRSDTMPTFVGNEPASSSTETGNQELVVAANFEDFPKKPKTPNIKSASSETPHKVENEDTTENAGDATARSMKLEDNSLTGNNAIAMYWGDGTATMTITTGPTPPATTEQRSILSVETMLMVFLLGVFCFLLREVLKLLGKSF